jgi:S-adenosyl methyltransferase
MYSVTEEAAPQSVDPRIPNAVRMYDHYLGGKTNFATDRMVGGIVLSVAPDTRGDLVTCPNGK